MFEKYILYADKQYHIPIHTMYIIYKYMHKYYVYLAQDNTREKLAVTNTLSGSSKVFRNNLWFDDTADVSYGIAKKKIFLFIFGIWLIMHELMWRA